MRKQCVKDLLFLIILANIGAYGIKAHAVVWETFKNPNGTPVKWTDPVYKDPNGTATQGSEKYTWDDVCSDWIRENVDVDIFNTPKTPFAEVPDCGKAAELIHLECAIHFNLPFALHGKKEFSNSSHRWDNIKDPDARIWAYKQFVNANSSSESIPDDSYAVDVNSTNVKPGSFVLLLDVQPYNHTLTVKSVSPFGEMTFINSTLLKRGPHQPPPSRRLFLTQSLDPDAIPSLQPSRTLKAGVRNWRHYDEALGSYIPLEEEKNYGYNPTKQFSEEFKKFPDVKGEEATVHTWEEAVVHWTKQYDGEPVDRINDMASASCGRMRNRAEVVMRGETILAGFNPRGYFKVGSEYYDSYSTPRRDEHIKDGFLALENLLEGLDHDNQRKALIDYARSLEAGCLALYGKGPLQFRNLAQFEEALLNDKVSSDPNASLDCKWGLDSCEAAVALNRN